MRNSPFTQTQLHIMSGALYPGLRKLRNRKGLSSIAYTMYVLSQFLQEPQLEFFLLYSHTHKQIVYQLL